MKNKFSMQDQLQLVGETVGGPNNHIVELEAILTRSALAHEYALIGLTEESTYTGQQEILAQMEQHKAIYFQARQKLEMANPRKLLQIEEELRLQKELVLRSQTTLH